MPAAPSTEPNPYLALLLLREFGPMSYRELARWFSVRRQDRTASVQGDAVLERLERAGLITGFLKAQSSPDERVVEVTKSVLQLQSALNLSLSEMSRCHPKRAIWVTPYHGRPAPLENAPDVLILAPFRPGLRHIYDELRTQLSEDLGCRVGLADEFRSGQAVMSEIWSAIASGTVVIADCTDQNPNVFYEIGLAHALGKEVLLITQSDDVPFDLRHLRYVRYHDSPEGIRQLVKDLHSPAAFLRVHADQVSKSFSEIADKRSGAAKKT
jgi:hypothetical protein